MGSCWSSAIQNLVRRRNAPRRNSNTGNPPTGPKIFVLVGRSGSGKSSFIERVTDQSGLSSNSIRPFTNEIKEYVASINGSNICLIDTPGFESLSSPMAINTWLKEKHPGQQLTGLLYFHDISGPRLQEDTNSLQRFRILCGKNFDGLVFTITHYNAANNAHVEREKLWKIDWASEIGHSAAVEHFENDRTSALKILEMRMTESDPQPSQSTHDRERAGRASTSQD